MLGRTKLGSLSVSVMAFGAMYLGTKTDVETSLGLLNEYADRGGNFIDTANNYCFWVEGGKSDASERLIGEWLSAHVQRDQFIVATKVGARPIHEGAVRYEPEGLSRNVIRSAVEMSLKNLRTEYVDLLYAHLDDRTVPLEETLSTFDELIKAGKVREIACSNHATWRIEAARGVSAKEGLASYTAIQQRHSYFQPSLGHELEFAKELGERGGRGVQEAVGSEMFDYAATHPGFRIVGYSPLLQGGVADPERMPTNYRTPDNENRRAVLEAVAGEIGASSSQVVFAWMMASPQEVIPLVASSRAEQLRDNLDAANVSLSPDQITRLNQAV